MATLDFSRSKYGFSMTDPNVVGFNTAYATLPDFWLFNTPAGHALRLQGSGLTYDAQGRAKTGTVTSIEIDLGNNDPSSPDVTITGINAPATLIDNGPADFWRFMEGNDVIYGPQVAQGASAANFLLVGDGVAARPGSQTGGSDVVNAGDGYVTVFGDVESVGSRTAGSPTSNYRGGHDHILGQVTAEHQIFVGDAASVHAGSQLTGGNDTILSQSSYGSSTVGDALYVEGSGGVLARVVGGNDDITAGANNVGALVGDVLEQKADSLVHGGADTIRGGELAEVIVGDVYRMTTSRLIGGNDTLSGNGGSDTISGDGLYVNSTNTVTGGHDVIRGGRGDDKLYGDFGNSSGPNMVGGDDRLYGDEGDDSLDGDSGNDVLNGGSGKDGLAGDDGDDQLYGGTENDNLSGDAGNDLMDGGGGADALYGGSGDDTFYVNDNLDKVYEGADGGHDTVWSTLAAWRLRGEVEDLRFNGLGSFTGIGNHLGNTIQGGAGADDLRGEDGNDVLIGGGGADKLQGGAGIDTASYASATTGGVNASLRGSANGVGDALGDAYVGVENLTGSDFGDALFGDDRANTLSGGAGDDNLQGQLGDDVLIGGAGQDDLVGQGGNDTFVFNARNEGRDEIYGFSSGAGNDDRLQFEGDAFGGLPTGTLSASRFVANTSGAATTSSQRFVYETDTGLLRFDANGSAAGGVTEIALLTNVPVLTFDDFVIV